MCNFSSFPIVTTLPEGNVGHETALSTDLGTDPKIAWLFLARAFALLMHIYVLAYAIVFVEV